MKEQMLDGCARRASSTHRDSKRHLRVHQLTRAVPQLSESSASQAGWRVQKKPATSLPLFATLRKNSVGFASRYLAATPSRERGLCAKGSAICPSTSL